MRTSDVLIRFADPEFGQLVDHVFSRYPNEEWATFAQFGWRETGNDLVLTLAQLVVPGLGELDENVPNVAFLEPYSLRMALQSEQEPLAVGVVHSHPNDCAPLPSVIDDEMDGYFSKYFEPFAPDRPYVSAILSKVEGNLYITGRVFWRGRWHVVTRIAASGRKAQLWSTSRSKARQNIEPKRRERLNAALGHDAAKRLQEAVVAVIGVGGTGSAAAEVLARAGVGEIVAIDPDHIEESNLERIHGSVPTDAQERLSKVELAKRHILSIDSGCRVVAIRGSVPQPETVDAIVRADAIVCCTDSQSSRLAVSDLAVRYLVPAIDCGVALEGQKGRITGEVVQFVRFLPGDPCALCRGMVLPVRVSQELMPEEERNQRRQAAEAAAKEGTANPNAYWQQIPQLNTVGFLTTAAGAVAAGYAIGWITGRFDPPFSRVQLNLVAPRFEVIDSDNEARADCTCRRTRGFADQAAADAYVTPPNHWSPAITV